MSSYECDICGLTDGDLPDGFIDDDAADLFFDRDAGKTWCVVHTDSDVRELLAGGEQSG